MQSFLQNMIGNIITFNNIYTSLTAAMEAGNTEQVYYYIGRMIYIIVNFEPIDDIALFAMPEPEVQPLLQQ